MFGISEQEFPYKLRACKAPNQEHKLKKGQVRTKLIVRHQMERTHDSSRDLCECACGPDWELYGSIQLSQTILTCCERTTSSAGITDQCTVHNVLYIVYCHCTTCVLSLYYMRTAIALHVYCQCTKYCNSVLPFGRIGRFSSSGRIHFCHSARNTGTSAELESNPPSWMPHYSLWQCVCRQAMMGGGGQKPKRDRPPLQTVKSRISRDL